MTDVSNVPRVLGNRYEIGDLIGRGGMAQVHLGYDTRLSRTVAIKVLRTDLLQTRCSSLASVAKPSRPQR